jgi:glycine cleavage system H protein
MIKDGYYYSKEHDWVKVEGNFAYLGLTDYAQDELGEIVYVDFIKEVGDDVSEGEDYASVESTKSTSQLFSPVNGEVVGLNEKVEDDSEIINQSPYDEGWIIKVKLSDPLDTSKLMSASDYENFLKTL